MNRLHSINNMLMRPELVQTPEPPSPERASEAGGWDMQMGEGKGEGNMRVMKGTGSVLCAWPAKGWQTVTLEGSGEGSAPAGNSHVGSWYIPGVRPCCTAGEVPDRRLHGAPGHTAACRLGCTPGEVRSNNFRAGSCCNFEPLLSLGRWYILVLEHCNTPASQPVLALLCTAELQPDEAHKCTLHVAAVWEHPDTPPWQLVLGQICILLWAADGEYPDTLPEGSDEGCFYTPAWLTGGEHSGIAALELALGLAGTLVLELVLGRSYILA